jgi:hypothetical protein
VKPGSAAPGILGLGQPFDGIATGLGELAVELASRLQA